MSRTGWVASMIACAAIHGIAHAVTFTATTTLDSLDASPGDGVCADADGQCSLRAAIQEANALAGEDTIMLGAGTYAFTRAGGNEDAAASGDLDITDDLGLQGTGAEATIIDGGALDRVVDLRGSTPHSVRLENLTLRNGFLGTTAWTGSFSGLGGVGIRVGTGTHLTMSHVDVSDNHSANMFGAVAIDNTGCIEGDHVRIIGNTDLDDVGSGRAASGGIETDGKNTCLVLEDSEISGNRGDLSGALHVDGGASVTFRRTLIADNSARFAGGLELNIGGEVLLENVTISGNAGNPGAALVDGGTRFTLVNSTVTANHGSNGTPVTGGILDVHGGFGLTFLRNTILAANGSGEITTIAATATRSAATSSAASPAAISMRRRATSSTSMPASVRSPTTGVSHARTCPAPMRSIMASPMVARYRISAASSVRRMATRTASRPATSERWRSATAM